MSTESAKAVNVVVGTPTFARRRSCPTGLAQPFQCEPRITLQKFPRTK